MHSDKIDGFLKKRKTAEQAGGQDRISKQHEKGKLTARERINLLLDEGSFVEVDALTTHHYHEYEMQKKKFFGDGIIGGYGMINGRQVYVFAYDFTVLGGTLSKMGAKKITKLMDHAVRNGCPIIGIMDSGGARIQDVVKTVLGEEVSFDELGGAMTHGTKSGVAHFVAQNEYECMDYIKTLLSYIPQNNTEEPSIVSNDDDPNRLDHNLISMVPEDSLKPYDMKEIIHSIVDNHNFFEVHELFAPNIIVGFARMNGKTIGIVASQPQYLAGALDIDSSNKASRFIRFCDCYHIPILTLVDTPGYMPGTNQEHNGIIRHGSKLLYAYSEATVPKITIVIGKAYGGAYIAMGSKNLRTDINYAWPTAQIAVLGSEAAVKIMNRKELASSKDPEALKKQLVDEFTEKFANPYVAASHGTVDTVIDPAETRPMVIKALEMLSNKRDRQLPRKHGNMNL